MISPEQLGCGDARHTKTATELNYGYADLDRQGIKHDSDKLRYDLVPPEAMADFVRVLTYGAKKYADRNWEKGIHYSRVYAALQRHLHAFWAGEDTDPESGLPHLAHAACCVMFLATYAARQMKGFDDRPVKK